MGVLALFVLLAAGTAHAAVDPCDPLVPEVCAYPFPNDYWLENGKLTLSPDTFPKDARGQSINVDLGGWNDLDGFSPMPGIVTYFEDLSIANCPRLWDINASLSPSSPTVLVDTSTGQLVPHWVELDHSSDANHPQGYKRTLILWPAHRLSDSTRYVVGMRGLVSNSARPILASFAFAALRDSFSTQNPAIESRRAHFNSSVFPVLAQVGVARSSLQLAWDFTVMSTHTLTNRMLTMRDDAFRRTTGGIAYRITESQDNPSSDIARRVHGYMTVPWYLNQVEPGVDVRVVTPPGDPNTALFNGEHEVSFTVLIPKSLVLNRTAGAVLQYGHGLFGSQQEVDTGYLEDEANRYGYVLAAGDWDGLCKWDVPSLAVMLSTDLSSFAMVPDRSHQGMLNALLLMRLVTSPAFVNDPHVVFNGVSTIDPTRRYYYGNSQGGIFGSVYMSVTTDVERGVIGVGGGPYSLLLPRSADFTSLFDLLKARYLDPLVRPLLLTLIQLLWDRMEPSGWVSHITQDPLPGCPTHTVVLHYGAGDAQVSWLGAHMLARSVKASMYASNIRVANETLFGFPFLDDTDVVHSNLIQGWEFSGVPNPPLINVPPSKKTDTHERPRRALTAQEQTHRFLTTGEVYNACGGACQDKYDEY